MTIQLSVIIFLTILNIIIYIKYSHILTCEGVEELCSSSKKDTEKQPQKIEVANTPKIVKPVSVKLSKEKIGSVPITSNVSSSLYTKQQLKDIFNLCNQILEYDKTVKKEDKLQTSVIISIDKLIKFYKENNFVDLDSILSSLKFILKSVYVSNPHLLELRMTIT
jgi:hypothetical protein